MAENFTPVAIANTANGTTLATNINQNFSTVASLFEDVLSRSGVSPNPMQADLDMNSNQIINLPSPSSLQSPARLMDILTPTTISSINMMFQGSVIVTSFGAKVDGVTDDTIAVQNAINSVATGGNVTFPPGTCVILGGLTVPAGVALIGSGSSKGGGGASRLTCNGTNVTIITSQGGIQVRDLFIFGGGLGSTLPAVKIGSGDVWLYNNIRGGSNAALISGASVGDFILIGNNFGHTYGSSGVVIANGAGGWSIRNIFNNSWPKSPLTEGSTISAWVASTSYSVGNVVSLGGYYIQCKTAGTSGLSSPTLQNYGTNIIDNTAVWLLAAPTTYYDLQLDGSGSFIDIMSDHSGICTAGIALTNTISGSYPQQVTIDNGYFGNNIQYGILANGGDLIKITNCYFNTPVLPAGAGIYLGSAMTGDVVISDGHFWNMPIGVSLNGGTNTIIKGNTFTNMGTSAINVAAGVTKFIISDNMLGSTSYGTNANAVTVATGSSDYYNIVNNIVHGATTGVVDGGTGTHKTLTGNI